MWPAKFFNRRYLDMFMSRDPSQLRFEAQVIAHYAQLRPGQSVGDFCCGTGDLLQLLQREHAVHAEGVELVKDYVELAQRRGTPVQVHQGDALTWAPSRPLDVALNWYSSFGYFDANSNRRLLRNIAGHLKPGGVLLLEVFHGSFIKQHFQAKLVYQREWQGEAYTVVRSSQLSEDGSQMRQQWSFEGPQHCDTLETCTQLFDCQSLQTLAQDAGFERVRIFTTPTAERPVFDELAHAQSPRLLVVATKR